MIYTCIYIKNFLKNRDILLDFPHIMCYIVSYEGFTLCRSSGSLAPETDGDGFRSPAWDSSPIRSLRKRGVCSVCCSVDRFRFGSLLFPLRWWASLSQAGPLILDTADEYQGLYDEREP